MLRLHQATEAQAEAKVRQPRPSQHQELMDLSSKLHLKISTLSLNSSTPLLMMKRRAIPRLLGSVCKIHRCQTGRKRLLSESGSFLNISSCWKIELSGWSLNSANRATKKKRGSLPRKKRKGSQKQKRK